MHSKALTLDPNAHPGAMVALLLTPEQTQAVRDAAGMPDAEADHVTVAYLGPDAAALLPIKNALVEGLAGVTRETTPLAGEIGGLARFAASVSSDDQDVIVALYDSPALAALRHEVCECLEACGIAPASDHGFTPHITLSYIPPDAPTPVSTLPRLPLPIAALSLVWAGERIDLPFQGEVEANDDATMSVKAVTNSDGLTAAAFLVAEDPDKPSTWHLQVRDANGDPDHRLMGAAWAALNSPNGYRGNRYAGPDIETARAKLRTLYEQEKLPLPGEAKAAPDEAEPPREDAAETPADEAAETCPECGAAMVDGVCPECGYGAKAVKAMGSLVNLTGAPDRVSTRGIVWGGADLVGDAFVRGETDLGAARSFVGMPVYYDHTHGSVKSQIGTVVYADEDDEGITFDIELDRSKAYIDEVRKLVQAGALGSSTGAVGHLVKRQNGVLKRWIIGEISLTPTPAEPRTHPAFAGKSLTASEEDTSMGEEQPTSTTTQPGADFARLADFEALRARVDEHETALSAPALKSVTELGGAIGGGLHAKALDYDEGAHKWHNFKALRTVSYAGKPAKPPEYPEDVFGGYVKAVFNAHKANPHIVRDALKALEEVYGSSWESDAAKALGTQAGVSAAYLIPEQFLPQLMAVAAQNDVFYGKTMVVPNDGGELVIPALDPSTSYSEGQSAYYGGVTVTWSNDDASSTDTTPTFKQVRLKTNSLKASTRVANSLMMRSAVAIDAVVGNLLGNAIGRARDYALIRGTGNGQPLGFMFSPAAIDVGGSAVDFATLAGMNDQVIPERDDNYIWIVSGRRRSGIWALQQTNNALVTLLTDLRGKPGTQLLGRPVSFTDKVPYASGDVSNSVNLVDPSMYVVSEFQGIALAVSDQARFEQDQTVIRAIMSIDGSPWLMNKIAVTSTPDYASGFVTI